MKKTKLVTSIRKINIKWSIHFPPRYLLKKISGFDTKQEAEMLCVVLNQIYENGRYAEFQDNLKRTKKMMDKFGL